MRLRVVNPRSIPREESIAYLSRGTNAEAASDPAGYLDRNRLLNVLVTADPIPAGFSGIAFDAEAKRFEVWVDGHVVESMNGGDMYGVFAPETEWQQNVAARLYFTQKVTLEGAGAICGMRGSHFALRVADAMRAQAGALYKAECAALAHLN